MIPRTACSGHRNSCGHRETAFHIFRRKGDREREKGRLENQRKKEIIDSGESCLNLFACHMSIPVSIDLQKEPIVCPQCGSTVRFAPDHCLRCMLSQAIGVSGDTGQILDGLLTEIDFQDA